MAIIYRNIADNIPMGRENAIPAKELAKLFCCTEREMRRQIELIRRSGVLICSSPDRRKGGYYRPRNSSETAEYFGRQLSRIGHIWAALSPFKQYLKALPIEGQAALDEYTLSDFTSVQSDSDLPF